MSYSIVENPFMPVVLLDGTRKEFNLLDTLSKAHNIREIEGENPVMTGALYRFAIALALAINRPKNNLQVAKLLSTTAFDGELVESYLSKWHNRFDICDEKHPFYQKPFSVIKDVAGELDINKHSWSVRKLMFVDDNTPTLFNHITDDDDIAFTYPQFVRWLITYQTFSCGTGKGIKNTSYIHQSTLVGRDSGTIYLVRGNNLFETLCLNMNLFTNADSEEDKPCWERNGTTNPQINVEIAPTGPMDILTWQTLWLCGLFKKGCVRRLYAIRGEIMSKESQDGMVLYRKEQDNKTKKTVWRGKKIDLLKGTWQDYHTFAANFKSLEDDKVKPPLPIQVLNQGKRFSIDVFGIRVSIKGGIAGWASESWPLPGEWIQDQDMYEHFRHISGYADNAWRAISDALYVFSLDFLKTTEENPNKDSIKRLKNAFLQIAKMDFWSYLKNEFRLLISSMSNGQPYNGCDPSEIGNYRTAWIDMLCKLAKHSYELALKGYDTTGKKIRAYAKGFRKLKVSLTDLEQILKVSKENDENEQN